jgi:hypothetical protein
MLKRTPRFRPITKGTRMTATIVGAWRTNVSIEGIPPFVNLTTFSHDGIVLNAFPTPSPAPPGSNHTLEFFTTAVGAWSAAKSGAVSLTFETLGVDEHGNPIGSHVITATATVASDGSSWSGPFTLTILDPAGKQTGSVSGTVAATRITP